MNRREAIHVIRKSISGFIECELHDALDMAMEALEGPTPDPITGLVPCGCGGKAEVAGCSGDADYYSIICVECNIDTDSYETKEDAKTAWNRAMGLPDA